MAYKSRAVQRAKATLAQIASSSTPGFDVGTMEDPQHRGHYERRLEIVREVQQAVEARDWNRARTLAKALADVPPRPPRSQRPRCNATTRKGEQCKMAAYWVAGEPAPRNGKCRLHGGLSTGPKTAEGKAAIAASNRRRARQEG